MKILITTPILAPAIGGPALYADQLSKEFEAAGHRVRVIAPSAVHATFASLVRDGMHMFFGVVRANAIFCLDQLNTGVFVALYAFLFRKPMVLRLEGDVLWERFVERTRQDITLSRFYRDIWKHRLSFTRKERLIERASNWVIRRATTIVFSSQWRKKMMVDALQIPVEKTIIIKNVIPPLAKEYAEHSPSDAPRVILWAGRMLYLKNLHRFLEAFAKIDYRAFELHLIGDGPERAALQDYVAVHNIGHVVFEPPIRHEELMIRIASAACVVLPSLSDVAPNLILEAASCGTPVLVTKESGIREYISDSGVFIDPQDIVEMAEKLAMLLSVEGQAQYRKQVHTRIETGGWQEAAAEWLALFTKA